DNEEVGVVKAYKPPATEENLGLYNEADRGHWRSLVAADNGYGVHPQSKQWFGCEIAKRLNLDLIGKNRKNHHKIAKTVLGELIENGWFKIVPRAGDDRREHQYLDLGAEAQEGGRIVAHSVVVMMFCPSYRKHHHHHTPHRALSPCPLFLAGGLGLSRPSAG